MKHEVTVRIFNRDYRLLTDESAEYTNDLASALNRRMAELLDGKSTLTSQDAAALIALPATICSRPEATLRISETRSQTTSTMPPPQRQEPRQRRKSVRS